jgi:hypothetical protein
MSTSAAEVILSYEAELRAALADLPAGDVEALLGDVRFHLEEVAAETAGADEPVDLVAVLGPPDAYAEELRAVAGLPTSTSPVGRHWTSTWPAIVLSVLVLVGGAILSAAVWTSTGNEGYLPPALAVFAIGLGLTIAVRASPESRRAIDQRWSALRDEMRATGRGRELLAMVSAAESGWWLVRAYPAVMLVELLAGDPRSVTYPLPSFFGTGPFGGAVVLCLTAVASLWLGLRFQRSPSGRWIGLAVDLVLVAGLGALLFHPGEWTPAACNGWPGC